MLVTKNHRLPLGRDVALGEMRKTPSWMFWGSYGQLIKPGNQTMKINVRFSALQITIPDMTDVLVFVLDYCFGREVVVKVSRVVANK